jgi:hypothetical protein
MPSVLAWCYRKRAYYGKTKLLGNSISSLHDDLVDEVHRIVFVDRSKTGELDEIPDETRTKVKRQKIRGKYFQNLFLEV